MVQQVGIFFFNLEKIYFQVTRVGGGMVLLQVVLWWLVHVCCEWFGSGL